MISFSSTEQPRVAFYVRGDMFGANDQQNAVVNRLRELDAADLIEGYEVYVWNSRVELSGAETQPDVTVYREFSSWADAAGVDIDPFFTVRERESFVDGTARELILPVMCLAVRDDGELRTVAPHRNGSETNTVQDCLDALETLESSARRLTVPVEE
jgi:DNA-binding Lrp family transcriptional regulator